MCVKIRAMRLIEIHINTQTVEVLCKLIDLHYSTIHSKTLLADWKKLWMIMEVRLELLS